MFHFQYPNFNSGRILKKEMLEAIKSYPLQLVETTYHQYQDGIISGFDIQIDEAQIIIEPGILKCDSRIFVMSEPFRIPYTATEEITILKFKVGPVVEDADFYTRGADIEFSTAAHLGPYEWELMRFKLKEGAYLRTDYQDFADLVTEYNTVNYLYQQRSLPTETTVSPVVIKQFCQEVENLTSMNGLDQTFCLQAMTNQWILPKQAIDYYIANRLVRPMKRLSFAEIHELLSHILIEIQRDQQQEGVKRHRGRKMIVE